MVNELMRHSDRREEERQYRGQCVDQLVRLKGEARLDNNGTKSNSQNFHENFSSPPSSAGDERRELIKTLACACTNSRFRGSSDFHHLVWQ
ncbi:hypothetical protein RRG08_052905 [Elysia crispata]|uniref:Uncharacterized protein n=1 Tax=Elysia crispata TaxID=231223 RepID=A0AAE1DEQ6_9GAST|nr:hypothetical protein RRG08_052905 [Elysia crispata]